MVAALGPGRFYGSGLPRPRVFPGDRVDPPAPVTDALLCWAREAHWSMGGLGAKRLRLQGHIEGNLVKLRRTARRDAKARAAGERPASLDALGSDDDESDKEEVEAQERALRREVVDEEDSDSSDSEDEELVALVSLVTIAAAAKRKRARKLFDDFDRIAPQKKKQKVAAVTPPAKASPKTNAAAAAPSAAAPVKASLKRKVADAKASPKRKAAEAPAARRTSPRSKH